MEHITEQQKKIIRILYFRNGGSPKIVLNVLRRDGSKKTKYAPYMKICKPIIDNLTTHIIKQITEPIRSVNRRIRFTENEKACLLYCIRSYHKVERESNSEYWIQISRMMRSYGFPIRNWISVNRLYRRLIS